MGRPVGFAAYVAAWIGATALAGAIVFLGVRFVLAATGSPRPPLVAAPKETGRPADAGPTPFEPPTRPQRLPPTASPGQRDVGQWRFDEGTGELSRDHSGYGGTAELRDGAAWTAGRSGRAVALNGRGAYVAISRAVTRTDRGFTVTAWVKLSGFDRPGTAVSQDGEQVSGFLLQVVPGSGGGDTRFAFARPVADSPGAGVSRATSPRGLVGTGWTHLAGVYDAAARELRLYVNGEIAGRAPFSSPWHATGATRIGRAKWAGDPVEFWPGGVDLVRIYPRAVSARALRALYQTGG